MHVVLLGDSVFDNEVYTRGEPAVAEHLRAVLPGARVTLIAVDGTTTAVMDRQIRRIPADADVLVLSVGGNDALMNMDLLVQPVRTSGQAFDLLRAAVDDFDRSYGAVLAALARTGKRIVACTVYNGKLDPRDAERARLALMTFDDAIARNARAYGADLIDLRAVCTEPGDYANPIEPSGQGGLKVARAVAAAVTAGLSPHPRMFGAA